MNLETWLKQQPSRMEGYRILATAMGCRWQTVQKWTSYQRIPAERVFAVEKATGISRHVLRPDIYPEEREAA